MKLLFFDIDRTLAIGKDIPESAEKGIAQVRKHGDLVFLCTGRNIQYVRKNFSHVADGFITNNGRLAYYRGEILFDEPIEEETLQKIRNILKEEKAGAAYHSKEEGFYEGPLEYFEHMTMVGDPGYLKQGIKEGVPFYNFDVAYDDKDHFYRIEEALKDLCILNPHDPYPSADVTIRGVEKADALEAVAKKFSVPIEDTYAFGDGANDAGMLKRAGHGIAMGNAMEVTKKAAGYITDDIDKDGVYKALLHFGLV